MIEAGIGLGANLGEPERQIREAVSRLDRIPGIRLKRLSSFHKTAPWGDPDQPDFVNAAAVLETTLSPRALLEACLSVEREMGRTRNADRPWGPRLIDIDILVYSTMRVEEPGLSIPHPRLWERAFAYDPLAEIWPGLEMQRPKAAEIQA